MIAQQQFGTIGLPEILIIVIGLCLVPAYFLPTLIAFQRKKTNRIAIAAVNVLLGWTVLGWIASLIWALSVQMVDSSLSSQAQHPILCASCGKFSPAPSTFCATCGKPVVAAQVPR